MQKMALACTAYRPVVARFTSPFCSSIQRFSFSALFLPFPLSIPRPKLFLSHPFSSSSHSSVLTTSSPPTLFDYKYRLVDIESPDKDDSAAEEDNLLLNHGEEEAEPLPEKKETESAIASLPSSSAPKLTIKEKKELASYAHSLGKKLKCQQIGKSGVTPAVAAAVVEVLEANELLKLKVHGSCPRELSDAIQLLENATGSVAVHQIGRTVILYRPSLSMIKKDTDKSVKQQPGRPFKSSHASKVQKRKNSD